MMVCRGRGGRAGLLLRAMFEWLESFSSPEDEELTESLLWRYRLGS